jgi:hypothetical protein
MCQGTAVVSTPTQKNAATTRSFVLKTRDEAD